MRNGKRAYSRVGVSWPVSMLSGKKVITGEIKDISLGGALIRCEELPSTEEALGLRIEITDLFCVAATVEYVRLGVGDSRTDSKAYYLAVRFTEMTKDQSRILDNAIEHATRRQGR